MADQPPFTFFGLDYRVWPGIAVIVSLLLALFIPWFSEWWRRKPKKTDLKFEGSVRHEQGEGYIGRLVIKNHSDNVAKSVEASVESITDTVDGFRDGFLPVPLNWTHIKENSAYRDIYGNQTVYLDVIGFTPSNLSVWLQTPIVESGVKNFYELYCQAETELKISIYQESGQVVTSKVKVIWDKTDTYKFELVLINE